MPESRRCHPRESGIQESRLLPMPLFRYTPHFPAAHPRFAPPAPSPPPSPRGRGRDAFAFVTLYSYARISKTCAEAAPLVAWIAAGGPRLRACRSNESVSVDNCLPPSPRSRRSRHAAPATRNPSRSGLRPPHLRRAGRSAVRQRQLPVQAGIEDEMHFLDFLRRGKSTRSHCGRPRGDRNSTGSPESPRPGGCR